MNKPLVENRKTLDFIQACNYLANRDNDRNWKVFQAEYIDSWDDLVRGSFMEYTPADEWDIDEDASNAEQIFVEYAFKFEKEYPELCDGDVILFFDW